MGSLINPFGVASALSYSAEVLSDSPTGYWRLGEASDVTTATDSSGAGRNGTKSGSFTGGAGGLLTREPSALSTDFSGGNVFVTSGAHWNTTTWTADAWFRPDAINAVNRVIVQHDDQGINMSWRFFQTTNKIAAYVVRNGFAAGLAVSNTALSVGTVYYVACRYDGTNLELYLNGVIDGTANLPGTTISSTGPIQIGAFSNGGEPMDGRIQEVAVYPTALSPTRIAAHYAAGI